MIFGGDAFNDWIGEISLMRDLTKPMEIISMSESEDQQAAAAAEESTKENSKPAAGDSTSTSGASAATSATAVDPPTVKVESADDKAAPVPELPPRPPHATASGTPSPDRSGASTPRPKGIPIRPAIMDKESVEEEARMDAAGVTEEEKILREKQKKKGLTKEQREELFAYEMERKRIRDERVAMLAEKLVNRLSLWTETDKGQDVTKALKDKTRLEVENLRMESFGLEILHAIGATYMQKATSFLKSQKFLGISGFFSRLKDKGTLAKETWGTISTAIDAQVTIEEMAKAEERGGEDWTDEKKAEYEKRVTGKILAAAWRGSKYEIQGVLRDVCDKVLNDKHVKLEKRIERAEGLMIIGDIFAKVSIVAILAFRRSADSGTGRARPRRRGRFHGV